MIEIEFAKRFIQRVTQFTDYNINVMDKDGIIIASRDANRVGSYHVAYQIVHGNEDIVEIHHENEYAGVKPGINMVVQVDALREGVVGVTGSPEEIRPVALIIKMALEEMMKYELQEEKRRSRKSQKERLIQMLTQIPTGCGNRGTTWLFRKSNPDSGFDSLEKSRARNDSSNDKKKCDT